MKKLSIFTALIFFSQHQSQVGINTQNPAATLDVVSKNTDGSKAEGFIPPRLSGDALHNAELNNLYGAAQNGAMVFVTSGATASNLTGQTVNVNAAGLYYFNSSINRWVNLSGISTTPTITLTCGDAVHTGLLRPNMPTSNASTLILYSNGNGANYNAQTVQSTGVTGLVATRGFGTMANGDGTVNYIITGTPSGTGVASFAITLGGQTCTFTRTIGCGAFIAPGVWKDFMCHNLGADYSADPLIPSAAIHGAKYQWGAKTNESGRYYSQADDQSNSGPISGWNSTAAPIGSWIDTTKTSSDPCPDGYRVPTGRQWQNVIDNNPRINVGTLWTDSPTNFTSAARFADLVLPAAGTRFGSNSLLVNRGANGIYWSSTSDINPQFINVAAVVLNFSRVGTSAIRGTKVAGSSIRCISEH